MVKKKRAARSARSKSAKIKKRIKKPAKKAVKTPKKVSKGAFELGLEKVGEVTHYFPHVKAAAVLMLKDGLRVGDGNNESSLYYRNRYRRRKERGDRVFSALSSGKRAARRDAKMGPDRVESRLTS